MQTRLIIIGNNVGSVYFKQTFNDVMTYLTLRVLSTSSREGNCANAMQLIVS